MSLAANGEEDPVSERKKVYIAEREIPALFEVSSFANSFQMIFL